MLTLLAILVVASEPLNDKVVEFARSQLGKKVGDGECSALAAAALRSAGAKVRVNGGWGEELPSIRDAKPGDLLQFEGAVFVHSQVREDGARVTLTYSYAHHTAIVSGVRKRGRRFLVSILHQNAGIDGGDEEQRRVVQEWVLDSSEMRGGTIKAYRPVPR